jgi:CRP-like cAMP-binding protein
MGRQEAAATVRAGRSPVELGLLSKEQFFTIMEESPETVTLLEETARERAAHSGQDNLARGKPEAAQ